MKNLFLFLFILFTTVLQSENSASLAIMKPIPDAHNSYFKVGSFSKNGSISITKLYNIDSVYAFESDTANKEIKLIVVEYNFIYQPKKGKSKVLVCKGAALKSNIKKLCAIAKLGDRIIIGNVRVRTSLGPIFIIPRPIVLEVKAN